MLTYGDLVKIKPEYDKNGKFTDKVFEITKVPYKSNEVNYGLKPVEGNGYGARAREYMLTKVGGDLTPSVPTAPELPPLLTGTVVRFRDALYVVTKRYPTGSYQLFPLGGSTKYWKHVERASMVVIDPEILSEALTAVEELTRS